MNTASNWIESIAGASEVEPPHIQKMLKAIDEAIALINKGRK